MAVQALSYFCILILVWLLFFQCSFYYGVQYCALYSVYYTVKLYSNFHLLLYITVHALLLCHDVYCISTITVCYYASRIVSCYCIVQQSSPHIFLEYCRRVYTFSARLLGPHLPLRLKTKAHTQGGSVTICVWSAQVLQSTPICYRAAKSTGMDASATSRGHLRISYSEGFSGGVSG